MANTPNNVEARQLQFDLERLRDLIMRFEKDDKVRISLDDENFLRKAATAAEDVANRFAKDPLCNQFIREVTNYPKADIQVTPLDEVMNDANKRENVIRVPEKLFRIKDLIQILATNGEIIQEIQRRFRNEGDFDKTQILKDLKTFAVLLEAGDSYFGESEGDDATSELAKKNTVVIDMSKGEDGTFVPAENQEDTTYRIKGGEKTVINPNKRQRAIPVTAEFLPDDESDSQKSSEPAPKVNNRAVDKLERMFVDKVQGNVEASKKFAELLMNEEVPDYKELFDMLGANVGKKDRLTQLAYMCTLARRKYAELAAHLSQEDEKRLKEFLNGMADKLHLEALNAGISLSERWNHVVEHEGRFYWDDDRMGLPSDKEPVLVFDPADPDESLLLSDEERGEYAAHLAVLRASADRKRKHAELEVEADSLRQQVAEKIAVLTPEAVRDEGGRYRVAGRIFDEVLGPLTPGDEERWYRSLQMLAGALRVRPATPTDVVRKISNMILNTVEPGKGNYQTIDDPEGAITFDEFERSNPGVLEGINGILDTLLGEQRGDGDARRKMINDLIKAIEERGGTDPEMRKLYMRAITLVPNSWHESNFKQVLAVLKFYQKLDAQPVVFSLIDTQGGWKKIEGSEVRGEAAQKFLDVDHGNYDDAMATIRAHIDTLPAYLRDLYIKEEKEEKNNGFTKEVRRLFKVLCQNFRNFGDKTYAEVAEHAEQFGLNREDLPALYAIYQLLKNAGFRDYGPLFKYLIFLEQTPESPKVPRVRFMERDRQTEMTVVAVDVEEKLKKVARRLAEERYERKMAEINPGSVMKIIPRFWKVGRFFRTYGRSLARQGYIDKYEQEFLEKLKADPNFFKEVMSGQGAGSEAEHNAEVDAIVNRFELGLSEDQVVPEFRDGALMDELNDLARGYLVGTVSDARFRQRAAFLIGKIRREEGNPPTSQTADNLVVSNAVEKMEDLKRRHVAGLVNLDLDNFRLALKLGRATNVDVHSDIRDTNWANRFVKKLQQWGERHKILKWFTSPTSAGIVTYGVVNFGYNAVAGLAGRNAIALGLGALVAAPALGPALAAVGAGIAVGGGLAVLHRDRAVIMQEAHRNRREALGVSAAEAETFEADLAQVTTKKRPALEMINAIMTAMGSGNQDALLVALAEAEARNEISLSGRRERGGAKVDLISFSDEKHVEQERTKLLFMISEGRKWLVANGLTKQEADDEIRRVKTPITNALEVMLTGQHQKFRTLKRRENAYAFGTGALFGAATSMIGFGASKIYHAVWGHNATVDYGPVDDLDKFARRHGVASPQYGEDCRMTPETIREFESHGFTVREEVTNPGVPAHPFYGGAIGSRSFDVGVPGGVSEHVTANVPADFQVPDYAYISGTHIVDRNWMISNGFSVTAGEASTVDISATSASTVLGKLVGTGALTADEVRSHIQIVDGKFTQPSLDYLTGTKHLQVTSVPVSGTAVSGGVPGGAAASAAPSVPGAAPIVPSGSAGFEHYSLGGHWHNNTPGVYESVQEQHLYFGGVGGRGLDASGNVVFSVDKMLAGGQPTSGTETLNVPATFSAGKIGLYLGAHNAAGELVYFKVPVDATTHAATVDFTAHPELKQFFDLSGARPRYLGEYVMCAQEDNGVLRSLAKIDGADTVKTVPAAPVTLMPGPAVPPVVPGVVPPGPSGMEYAVTGEFVKPDTWGYTSPTVDGECPTYHYLITGEKGEVFVMPPVVVSRPVNLEKYRGGEGPGENGQISEYFGHGFVFVGPDGEPLEPVNPVQAAELFPQPGYVAGHVWTEWDWGNIEPLSMQRPSVEPQEPPRQEPPRPLRLRPPRQELPRPPRPQFPRQEPPAGPPEPPAAESVEPVEKVPREYRRDVNDEWSTGPEIVPPDDDARDTLFKPPVSDVSPIGPGKAPRGVGRSVRSPAPVRRVEPEAGPAPMPAQSVPRPVPVPAPAARPPVVPEAGPAPMPVQSVPRPVESAPAARPVVEPEAGPAPMPAQSVPRPAPVPASAARPPVEPEAGPAPMPAQSVPRPVSAPAPVAEPVVRSAVEPEAGPAPIPAQAVARPAPALVAEPVVRSAVEPEAGPASVPVTEGVQRKRLSRKRPRWSAGQIILEGVLGPERAVVRPPKSDEISRLSGMSATEASHWKQPGDLVPRGGAGDVGRHPSTLSALTPSLPSMSPVDYAAVRAYLERDGVKAFANIIDSPDSISFDVARGQGAKFAQLLVTDRALPAVSKILEYTVALSFATEADLHSFINQWIPFLSDRSDVVKHLRDQGKMPNLNVVTVAGRPKAPGDLF